MSSKYRDLIKMTGVIAVAFGLGITFAQAFNLPRPGMAESGRPGIARPAAAVRTAMPGTGKAADLPSFADVVDHVNPSVVYVQTIERAAARSGDQQVPPEFQDFFRRFQQQQQPQNRLRQGSGTGFIVSHDGYILTNNHVVEGADRVTVKLLDNREFNARVVGRDPNTDVAVIKIDADNLPAVTFGNSDQARIGDWVLAFGNPLGFQFTVTSGIVSAKGRQLAGLRDTRDPAQQYSIQDFIQTDAAINPGNSGGPLVNLSGEVIGINSAIASSTGLYAGYGFAIPANLAHRVMDDLISKGHVDRAVLGIGIAEVRPEDAEQVGLHDIKGVLVGSYSGDNSPARAAGILPGDVITAVNDTAVDHVAQLQQLVGFRRSGEHVRVTVTRRENGHPGVHHTFDVRLIAADQGTRVASRGNDSASPSSEMEGRLGLRVETIPADVVSQTHLTEAQQGVVVTDIEDGGPAFNRILTPQEGGPDVILKVNDQRVKTPDDFKKALHSAPAGSVVQLQVMNLGSPDKPIRIVNLRSR